MWKQFGLAVVMAFTAVTASAESFVAGKHYIELDKPVKTADPAKVEVAEYFGYWCPHCNNFEPVLNAWAEGKAEDVAITKVPVVFRGNQELAAKAYYVAKQLKVEPEVSKLMFDYYHGFGKFANLFDDIDKMQADQAYCAAQTRQGASRIASRQKGIDENQVAVQLNRFICGATDQQWALMKLSKEHGGRLNDDAVLEGIFAIAGADTNNFAKRLKSFALSSQMKQGRTSGFASGINSVPTIVVNGKYRVNGSTAGSNKKMLEVVDYLIEKERQTLTN